MSEPLTVNALQCEYLHNPLGIDSQRPRLSWKLIASRRDVRQSAYQIQVARLAEMSAPIWDSGQVMSAASAHVAYGGPKLLSRQRYFWRVRVWDEAGVVSAWSETAFWEMGLLDPADWQAKWIEPQQKPAQPEPPLHMFQNLGQISPAPDADYSRLNPCLYVRRPFTLPTPSQKARLYATAHGVYRLFINGRRVGTVELAPEPTAYQDYLQVQTYDVTALIQPGENVLEAVLGDGWYCGRIGLPGDSCQYGDKLALLCQLEMVGEDGRFRTITSDETFTATTGPLIYSDLFIGERYDARRERENWQPVTIADYGTGNLVAQVGEPMRVVAELPVQAIRKTPNGETVLDLGQNIHGKLRMRVQGPAGTEITLDHSETLDAEGNFLHKIRGRNKDQRDVCVLKGGGAEVYEPWFTTHGFRYVRLSGYPGEPQPEDFTGLVVASDLRTSGQFSCSDERLNQLQQNIVWSQRGNFSGIPTDCPQRERAGFTGDAQVFMPTACFNMDIAPFITRWLRNLQIEQQPDGQVPVAVPYWKSYVEIARQIQGGVHTSAGWGDACLIVPWTLYQTYGDTQVLAENYETMTRWLAYVQKEAEQGIPERLAGELTDEVRQRQRFLWNSGFHFGDWLIPSLTAGYGNPFDAANATKEIAASCFYAHSTALLANIAVVLGKADDHERYSALNARIRAAFTQEYVAEDGRLRSHYQGMYVLALRMDMVPEAKRPLLTAHLVNLIAENGYRLDTGFVSTPYLLDVLVGNGRLDVAAKLLFQTHCPSWLYEVEQGATTIWESWDAIAPDGTVNLASFNHYAFGAVGDWLYRTVAGLDKSQPGYKHVLIQPRPFGHLTHAQASYHSIYGEIVSAWELHNGTMRVQATIPPNTTATIRLPAAQRHAIIHEGNIKQDGQDVVVDVGSGTYDFAYAFNKNHP